jgi:hypothetical protein
MRSWRINRVYVFTASSARLRDARYAGMLAHAVDRLEFESYIALQRGISLPADPKRAGMLSIIAALLTPS